MTSISFFNPYFTARTLFYFFRSFEFIQSFLFFFFSAPFFFALTGFRWNPPRKMYQRPVLTSVRCRIHIIDFATIPSMSLFPALGAKPIIALATKHICWVWIAVFRRCITFKFWAVYSIWYCSNGSVCLNSSKELVIISTTTRNLVTVILAIERLWKVQDIDDRIIMLMTFQREKIGH